MSANVRMPEKYIENGHRSSRPAFHTSSFILHPLSYAFRHRIRASAMARFVRRSRDENVEQDTPGGERGPLSRQSRHSLAFGNRQSPCGRYVGHLRLKCLESSREVQRAEPSGGATGRSPVFPLFPFQAAKRPRKVSDSV